jgi:hypothetical protein
LLGPRRALLVWRSRGDVFEPVTRCACGKLFHWPLATVWLRRLCRVCNLTHEAVHVKVRGDRIVLLKTQCSRH